MQASNCNGVATGQLDSSGSGTLSTMLPGSGTPNTQTTGTSGPCPNTMDVYALNNYLSTIPGPVTAAWVENYAHTYLNGYGSIKTSIIGLKDTFAAMGVGGNQIYQEILSQANKCRYTVAP